MGDTYRPAQPDRDRDRHRDRDRDRDRDHPPPLAERMTFTNGGDSYRPPGPPQSRADSQRFTFQSAHPAPHFPPAGPSHAGARGPPTAPRRRDRDGPPARNARRDGPRARNNNHPPFRRGGFRKAAPHERALLQQRDDGVEQAMGISDGPNRFKDLADLSDPGDSDMDLSAESADEALESHDHNGAHQNGTHQKVARTVATARSDGDSVPKWSNPDPYTVLPPPEETTGKRIDFVNLIRKAKNAEAETQAANNAVAANDDFISFGDEDKASVFSDVPERDAQPPLPKRPKRPLPDRPMHGSLNDVDLTYMDSLVHNAQNTHRRFDDDARSGTKTNKFKRKLADDGPPLEDEWLPVPTSTPTPWLQVPAPYAHLAQKPDQWLHNEILDFYDFVAPQPYEHELRNELVNRVNNALGNRRFPQDTGRILCFGSFPAGLYLPTADMDLVYTSDRYYNGGPPALDFSRKGAHKNLLYKASNKLKDTRMCKGQPIVIATAKVPLIKFVDSYTHLQVDVSFENLSGVQAQATFAHWKQQYPDMIYLVALLKQFLVMHGLNEVHTGGIGGFSIICLVVSYIQHAPKPNNLGECFVGFLDYYGNKFDLATQRIQMNPPAVVKKTRYGIDDREEKPDGLSIQDPNRPENNISGGSHRAKDTFKAFAAAHKTLEDRIQAAKAGQDIGSSILECVLGGNYSSYIKQRRHMRSLK
ncbi:hypothetical protein ACN47E_000947 [Coniothyrium glycines]